MARPILLLANQPDLAAALGQAVATTTGPDRPATLAAMDSEIAALLRRQTPGSAGFTMLHLARSALREARATRH